MHGRIKAWEILFISTLAFLFFIYYKESENYDMVFFILAGLFEVGWAFELKYSQGFTKLVPSIFTIVGMIATQTLYYYSRFWYTTATGNNFPY
jgi:hypothetical protein